MNSEQHEKIVALWSERAWAYNQLIEDWPIFTDLADRLVDMIDAPRMESVLDLGAGTGLLAQRVLDMYPKTEVHIMEPSEAMLALAERRLGHKVRYHRGMAEGPFEAGLTVSTVLSSACMHLVELDRAMEHLAPLIRSGGNFCFNLWWHSFSETALDGDMKDWWRPAMEEILEQDGYRSPKWPEPSLRRPHSRNSLRELGKRFGFEVASIDIDEDRISKRFAVDFMAMDKHWPVEELGGKRKDIIQRIKDQIEGDERMRTVRVLFKKT
jgi:SAM-dependent methyltransferase